MPLQIASGLWFSALIYSVFAVLVGYGWWTWVQSRRRAALGAAQPSRV